MRVMHTVDLVERYDVYFDNVKQHNVVEADDEIGYVDVLIQPKDGGGFRRQRFYGQTRIERINDESTTRA